MNAVSSNENLASDPFVSAGLILQQLPELHIHDNTTDDFMEEEEEEESEEEEELESDDFVENVEIYGGFSYDQARDYFNDWSGCEEEADEDEEEDMFMDWDTEEEEEEEKEMENIILNLITRTAGGSPVTASERVVELIRLNVSTDAIKKFIVEKFCDFLNSFRDFEHEQQIKKINSGNKSSLEIDYNQIRSFSSDIADFLVCAPKVVLAVMEQVARKLFADHTTCRNRNQDVYVRISELPLSFYNRITRLSSSSNLYTMVRTGGVVAGLSYHLSIEFRKYIYHCDECKEKFGPYKNSYIKNILYCPCCESLGTVKVKQGKPFYQNYQAVTLKEDRETADHGIVIMLNDHIDLAKPGDNIEVIGVLNDFFVYLTVEANNVKLLSSENKVTEDDLEKIDKLSKDPNIGKLIIKSLATSICGHEDVKTALALSIFSGQLNPVGKLHRRGDVNVLLVGYPSSVKSQILENVKRTGQRFVHTTGKGFSEVGLIGAVREGRIPILQAGPLVWADKGICFIDDFEKMSEQDSGNIDEALEQQTISRSWIGGVKTMDARCSVVAAANPCGERYDSFKSFYEQVKLNKSTISHFDIICIMKDEVNPELVHGEKYNAADPEIIPSDLLQKYITFAKLHVSPHLKAENFQELEQLYPELRNGELLRKAARDHLITERRHLEAVIRMSEAHAKMHLRSDVIKEDVEMAIEVMLNTCLLCG